MKKGIALLLACAMLLTMVACGSKEAETAQVPETTQAPVTEPTETTVPAPTEPQWQPGTIRAGYGEAVYAIFDVGTQLKVIGQFRHYYVVEREDVDLLVHKEMLRMEGEEAFESWTGYSRSGTEVYTNAYLRGEPIATLNKNTPITVLESNGGWASIQWEGGEGYARTEQLSKWRISSGGGGSSDGGGGGGSSGGGGGGGGDGTDVPIGSLTSADGSFAPQVHLLGDYYGPEMEEGFEGGMATVLAPNTEGYICLLLRGDEVKVTEAASDTATIWLGEELFARIPRGLVQLEEDAPYESWTGYSRWDGVIYEESQMATESVKLSTNKQVTVLDEVDGVYVVEYEGTVGYMNPEKLSQTKIPTGSGKSDEGGGGGGGGSSSTWTPPAM